MNNNRHDVNIEFHYYHVLPVFFVSINDRTANAWTSIPVQRLLEESVFKNSNQRCTANTGTSIPVQRRPVRASSFIYQCWCYREYGNMVWPPSATVSGQHVRHSVYDTDDMWLTIPKIYYNATKSCPCSWRNYIQEAAYINDATANTRNIHLFSATRRTPVRFRHSYINDCYREYGNVHPICKDVLSVFFIHISTMLPRIYVEMIHPSATTLVQSVLPTSLTYASTMLPTNTGKSICCSATTSSPCIRHSYIRTMLPRMTGTIHPNATTSCPCSSFLYQRCYREYGNIHPSATTSSPCSSFLYQRCYREYGNIHPSATTSCPFSSFLYERCYREYGNVHPNATTSCPCSSFLYQRCYREYGNIHPSATTSSPCSSFIYQRCYREYGNIHPSATTSCPCSSFLYQRCYREYGNVHPNATTSCPCSSFLYQRCYREYGNIHPSATTSCPCSSFLYQRCYREYGNIHPSATTSCPCLSFVWTMVPRIREYPSQSNNIPLVFVVPINHGTANTLTSIPL